MIRNKGGGREKKKTREIEESEMETEIRRKEMKDVITKLKKWKAPRRDGIMNEAWLIGREELEEELGERLNDLWMGGEMPEK